jgi:hypothetical protein
MWIYSRKLWTVSIICICMSTLDFGLFYQFVNAGGESTAGNCQILQTRVNRLKSGKDNVDPTQLKGYSCDVKFTGMLHSISQ